MLHCELDSVVRFFSGSFSENKFQQCNKIKLGPRGQLILLLNSLSLVPEGWQLLHLAQFNVANGKKRIRCLEIRGRKGLGKISGHVSVLHLYCQNWALLFIKC